MPKTFVLILAVLLASACDSEPLRGAAGESCTSRDDCERGLHCIALVCVSADAGTPTAVVAQAGGEGDACSARRNCRSGLACVANECVAATMGSAPGSRYSGRGESCTASNECAANLACAGGMCVAVTIMLEHTAKMCARIECADDVDCCSEFVPNPNCAAYKQNCDTDPVFCNTYRSLCECSQHCLDELCTSAAPGCSADAECTSTQTPFCVDSSCVQCQTDANCPGLSSKCVEGVCMSACQSDEQCAALHTCQDGECVETGCRTDRECVFISGDPSSLCRDGKCQAPCDTDSDCSTAEQRFNVCIDGQCEFVGCETDAECRALLHLQTQASSKVHAVCR